METKTVVNVAGPTVSLSSMLGVLFIGLKLTASIDWTWFWVLSPFWIPFALWMVIILVLLLVGIVGLVVGSMR